LKSSHGIRPRAALSVLQRDRQDEAFAPLQRCERSFSEHPRSFACSFFWSWNPRTVVLNPDLEYVRNRPWTVARKVKARHENRRDGVGGTLRGISVLVSHHCNNTFTLLDTDRL